MVYDSKFEGTFAEDAVAKDVPKLTPKAKAKSKPKAKAKSEDKDTKE